MKRRFGFVIGACMIIGMIDLVTEQVVFATIYNPLDPSEEIVPTDPPEEIPEKVEEPPTEMEESKEQPAPEPETVPKKEPERSSLSESSFLEKQKHFAQRVMLEDVFAPDRLNVDLAMPGNNTDGDGDDKPSYLASLCYLFSGNVLYGQKNNGGLKTHVCDIFE